MAAPSCNKAVDSSLKLLRKLRTTGDGCTGCATGEAVWVVEQTERLKQAQPRLSHDTIVSLLQHVFRQDTPADPSLASAAALLSTQSQLTPEHRSNYERRAERARLWLAGFPGLCLKESVTEGEFSFCLGSKENENIAFQFRVESEKYLLAGVRKRGGFLGGMTGGPIWIGDVARRIEADVAADPEGKLVEFFRGTILVHTWLETVGGHKVATSFEAGVDNNFGMAAVSALGLCAVAGSAPTRTAFILAHRACQVAIELCCYASSWSNGDHVVMRWVELANRAAEAKVMKLEEALTLESYITCIAWRVCGLAGPYMQSAWMAAGRAVALLGGQPITLKHRDLAIMLTTVTLSKSEDTIESDFGGWRAPIDDIKNAHSYSMPPTGWCLQGVTGIT